MLVAVTTCSPSLIVSTSLQLSELLLLSPSSGMTFEPRRPAQCRPVNIHLRSDDVRQCRRQQIGCFESDDARGSMLGDQGARLNEDVISHHTYRCRHCHHSPQSRLLRWPEAQYATPVTVALVLKVATKRSVCVLSAVTVGGLQLLKPREALAISPARTSSELHS